ncbi:WcaI family glycosyltransferase [Novosphingobium sp.]|uniref:WcaI family glycosyltransferase n=1 Tax=Novosphingobium sp. TaxID=1874826 RepID=UPI003BA8970D
MTRIALVSLNYAPEEIGIGPYSTGLAEGLVARGSAVEAISGHAYYPRWKVFPQFAGKGWLQTSENGVQVWRCPHYVPAQPSGLKRTLHLLSFGLAAFRPALRAAFRSRGERPDLVICVVPALFSVPSAWLLARLSGARLWIHVQDFEIEAAFATGLLKDGVLGRFARWVEKRLLRSADVVSSISPQMCRRLGALGCDPDRVVELRNWANAPGRDPDAGAYYRQLWGLEGKKVALYSGNIANKQGIEIIVDVARHLAGRDDIVFVVCGEGPNRANLEQRAKGLTNIRFNDLQPAERLGQLLGLASVHLLPQLQGAADLVLPSKLANMLASARPVVATAEQGTALYDEVDGCGINTPPGDSVAMAAAIEKLLDDSVLYAQSCETAVARSVSRWSYGGVMDQLEYQLSQRLLGPTP